MSAPRTAMVLAAGLGTRMRALNAGLPKPLVRLAGKALIDHVLDRLADAGVARAVVNVHHRADAIEAHLAGRTAPEIVISDERGELLDTGGGVNRPLAELGPEPFLVHNSDSVWIEGARPCLETVAGAWDGGAMDALLLVAAKDSALGYGGAGDFDLDGNGRLARVGRGVDAAFVFAGVSLMHPRLFAGAPDGPFSLNLLWDKAIAAGRLCGVAHTGHWMHVGTPEALAGAEERLKRERV